jgi:predicted GH43/DUF377 family glycosyl hydrolase
MRASATRPTLSFPVLPWWTVQRAAWRSIYGAADTVVALAFARIDELIAFVKENAQ